MGPLGMQELLVILLIVLVLFGAKKIPDLASGLGKGIKEFKKAQQDETPEVQDKQTISSNQESEEKKQ